MVLGVGSGTEFQLRRGRHGVGRDLGGAQKHELKPCSGVDADGLRRVYELVSWIIW